MAKDVITRFKLETTGFDSKIKQAAKDLSNYSKTATQAKEGFNQFTKSNIDAAKALGTMTTSTTNVKDKVKELVGAYNEAAKAYEALTKEQQQSDWAKALAGSLTQLQQRIKETKQEMQGLGDSAKGGIFSGLGSKMEGALAVFGGNLMTKAAGAIASLGSEMADMVKQGVEMAKAGEGIRIAFERLGRGDILDGLREATHGTVTDLELMKAAVKFNDFKLPVEELGTMLAFAQQKAKDTGQSVDYMVDSIVTGLGRKSLMILDNLGLSATEIRERMKETGDMTKAVGDIIRDQMAKAGDYVETAADRAAQANVSLQNKMEELGRKFAPIEEASNQLWTSMKIGILDVIGGPLARLLNGLTEAGRLKNALNDLNGGGNGKESQTEKALRLLREYSGGRRGIEGKRDLYNRQVASYSSQEEKAWREANRLREELKGLRRQQRENGLAGNLQPLISEASRQLEEAENRAKAIQIMRANYQKGAEDIFNPKPAPTTPVVPTTKPTKTTKTDIQYADDSIMAQEKLVSDLTQKWKTASGELRDGYLKDLEEAQKKLAEMTGKAKVKGDGAPTFTMAQLEGMSFDNQMPTIRGNSGKAQDKLDLATAAFATGGTSNADFSNYISGIKNALSNANLGDELYTSMTEKLKDATTVSTLLQEMMERGLAGADLERTAQALKEKLLSPEGIDQTAVQSLLEELNKQIEEAGGVGLKLNADTGEVTDDKDKDKGGDGLKEAFGKFKEFTSGLNQVASGLQQMGIQLPKGVSDVLGVVNGVISVIQGISSIISVFQVSAITANTIALGALTSAVTANTVSNFIPGLSNGGIVPAFAQGGTIPKFADGGLIGRAAGGMMIPGNSMSGDNLRLPVDGGRGMIGVNSGELILNRSSTNTLAASLLQAESLVDSISDYRVSLGSAQQMSLASELEGGAAAAENTQPFINGEMIYLGLQAYMRRSGLGEIVTSER